MLDVIEPKGVPGDQLDRAAWLALGYQQPGDQFTVSAKNLRKPFSTASQFYSMLERWADGKRPTLSGPPDIELMEGDAAAIRQSAHYWFDRLKMAREEGSEPYPGGAKPPPGLEPAIPPEPTLTPEIPDPTDPSKRYPVKVPPELVPDLDKLKPKNPIKGAGGWLLLLLAAWMFTKE